MLAYVLGRDRTPEKKSLVIKLLRDRRYLTTGYLQICQVLVAVLRRRAGMVNEVRAFLAYFFLFPINFRG